MSTSHNKLKIMGRLESQFDKFVDILIDRLKDSNSKFFGVESHSKE